MSLFKGKYCRMTNLCKNLNTVLHATIVLWVILHCHNIAWKQNLAFYISVNNAFLVQHIDSNKDLVCIHSDHIFWKVVLWHIWYCSFCTVFHENKHLVLWKKSGLNTVMKMSNVTTQHSNGSLHENEKKEDIKRPIHFFLHVITFFPL